MDKANAISIARYVNHDFKKYFFSKHVKMSNPREIIKEIKRKEELETERTKKSKKVARRNLERTDIEEQEIKNRNNN